MDPREKLGLKTIAEALCNDWHHLPKPRDAAFGSVKEEVAATIARTKSPVRAALIVARMATRMSSYDMAELAHELEAQVP